MTESVDTSIYTVGYGNRTVPEVLALVKRCGVECLVDVRTSPYSRFKPEYSREALENAVTQGGLRYVFLGDLLGGRPEDLDCYENGRVDYERLRQKEFYRKGIDRLRRARDQGVRLAVMCSELRPEECHRSKLIAASLTDLGIPVIHIDEEGLLLSQEDVIHRLTSGQLGLFGEPAFTSRKRYEEPSSDEQ